MEATKKCSKPHLFCHCREKHVSFEGNKDGKDSKDDFFREK